MRICDGSSDVSSSARRDPLQATIRLMPAADPPHRAPPGATADQRAEMLDLAVAGEPGLAVDRRELRRDCRSYSIDTLLELRTELGGDAPVALLVGADRFVGLPDWLPGRELLDPANFFFAQRPGRPLDRHLPPAPAATLEIQSASCPDRWCQSWL